MIRMIPSYIRTLHRCEKFPSLILHLHPFMIKLLHPSIIKTRATARVPSPPNSTPALTMNVALIRSFVVIVRAGEDVDAGRRPLRSPSCPRCHMLTLPRDTFIFIRTFNAEKAGSKSVEMHITGIKLQAGIVFVSQLLYL